MTTQPDLVALRKTVATLRLRVVRLRRERNAVAAHLTRLLSLQQKRREGQRVNDGV